MRRLLQRFPDDTTFEYDDSNGTIWINGIPLPSTGVMQGDAGSGGTAGAVPAPPAGSAAAGEYLSAAGTYSTPSGGGGAVSLATVDISSAQLLSLISSGGVQLIAAPGAGKAVLPISLFFAYIPNTVGYTVPSGATFHFAHQGASTGDDWFLDLNAIAVQSTSPTLYNPTINEYDDVFTPVENIPFYFKMSGATELTLGDGKVRIAVAYITMSLT